MNLLKDDVVNYFKKFNSLCRKNIPSNFLTGVSPSSIFLSLTKKIASKNINIVAQHVCGEEFGPFTGNISYKQIIDFGIKYCLVGHSETRFFFNISDNEINKIITKLISSNITPILCVGEPKEIFLKNKSTNYVFNQVMKAFKNLKENDIKKVIIAYEPIWAIGKQSASFGTIQKMYKSVKRKILNKYKLKNSEIKILYGGSVNKNNIIEIFKTGVDGVLIGNASLNPETFYEIIMLGKQVVKH
jgi:triosephosphate isomerase